MHSLSWEADEAALATGGRNTGPWVAKGVSIDSRTIGAGELFVALVGERVDGHDYLDDAFEAGAAAAMVSSVPTSSKGQLPLLVVSDTRTGLTALGTAGRSRSRAMVIGVTGSVGKTGTKEMLRLVLSEFGFVHASRESYNNAIGVPLTLANLPKDADYAVIEIGMSHSGEIAPLSKMSRPNVGVITNVSAAHIANFKDVDEIADAKAELFDGIDPDGIAILNRDNDHFRWLNLRAQKTTKRVISFGCDKDADVQLVQYDCSPGQNAITVKINDQRIIYTLGADGLHWAHNTLAVLGVVYGIGKNPDHAMYRLANFQGVHGRGIRYLINPGNGVIELIDDSYNANPTSMTAALKLLGELQPRTGGRKIAVLGDMLELGHSADSMHANLLEDVIAANVDLTFTVGSHMLNLHSSLSPLQRGPHAHHADALISSVISVLGSGDVVLVKGSHGINMGCIVSALLTASGKKEAF